MNKRVTRMLQIIGAATTAVALIPLGSLPAQATTAKTAATDPTQVCSSMTSDIYQANNPKTQASLLSRYENETTNAAAKYGFTDLKGGIFKASKTEKPGLVPVYRLYQPKSGNFVYIPKHSGSNEYELAISKYGYQSQSVEFYASVQKLDCGVPVYRFYKNGYHRFAVDEKERDALTAAGWSESSVRFWVSPETTTAPPTEPPTPGEDADGVFTLAIAGDTQNEVIGSGVTRGEFLNRADWLVANKDKEDIRFFIQTGDLVNWDTPNHDQYRLADQGIDKLKAAGLPSALVIGNHDTQATCEGGSACPGKNIPQAARDTHVFNEFFPVSEHATGEDGAFEAGKIDNSFQTFEENDYKFLILTLELWPRTEAVNWAKQVVASHPDYNVIIATHSYLEGNGTISQSNGGYGSNSPQYVYNHLISQYPNIKMVFSGHTGQVGYREDTGVSGNKVVTYLFNDLGVQGNPTRLLKVDTTKGTLTSRIYSPRTNQSFSNYDRTASVQLVK